MPLPVSSHRRKFLVGSPMGAVSLALLATVGCSSGEGAESSSQGETAEAVSVSSDAVASRKVEPAVAAAVARGEERRLLVVFDDAAIERDAGFVKKGRGVDADGDFARRAALHAAAKHDVFSRVRSRGLAVTRDYDRLPVAAVRVSSQEALEDLAKQPHVLALSEDRQLHTSLASTLPYINQPKAVSEGKTGANTSVVVLDTGTDYTRSAFGSCTAPGVPSTCRVAAMVEIAPNDNTLDDPAIMHGTNVAGIIAGVAPGTKIIGIDVFDGDGAWTSDIVAGINWAIANKNLHNIAAINMSLGGGQYFSPCATDAMAVAIKNAKDAGILSAVASGNESFTDSISGPACAPAAVAVGAVYDANYGSANWGSCQDTSTGGDKVVCFSNSSNMVTVLAPGVSVNAAGITMSGTSQATPHVAGSIATLRAAFPSDTPDQLVERLTSTGKPVTDARNSITKPRINLGAAAAGCALQLSPGSKVVGPLATTFDVTLTTGANCAWSLASNQPWVTITSPSSGTGTATVSLAVEANASASRTAKLTATGTESTGTVDISQTDDTVAPTGTVAINGGATSTRATTVALAMTGTDISGVTEMCVTNGASCTTFEPFAASKAWTLDPGDGPKTVTVFLKDGLGNVTAASSAPKASIVLDGTAPTDGTLVATAPLLTSSGAVILTWSGFADAGAGVASYKLVVAPGAAPSSCNEGTVIFTGAASSFQHSGLVSGTTYGYRLCAEDGAGNVSTGATATATATVDRAAPTGSVVINGNAPYTRSRVVTLGISATDPSGVTRMCVSPTTTCNAWEPYRTSKSISVGNGQGARSVFVWFQDSLGNRSSTPVTDSIVVDTVAPTMGSISARTASNALTISWSAARDGASGVASYKLVGNAGRALPNAQCTNGTVVFNGLGTAANVTGLSPQSTYSFRLCAVDNAGNTSSGSAFRLTTARR